MKKTILILFSALIACGATAHQIGENEAKAIAATKVAGLSKNAVRIQAKGSNAAQASAPVYIFSAPQGGFAIVAGDDSMPNMLLAYSETGHFDLNNCHPAMLSWLDEMSAFIAAGDFSTVRRSSLDYSNPVEPLIKTKWDQDDPYNMLTPLAESGKHCPTGCGATALAQIMNYWQYPKEGGLCEHSYNWNGQTLSVDFRQSRYDWDNMADIYDSNATEAQKEAVAKLMYDCGVAMNMEYAEESSNAIAVNSAIGIVDILGYSKSLRVRAREIVPADEWDGLVKGELDAARPVFYMGFTESDEGHAFVCDGYDSEGMYHINWGWGGYNDGYYDLDTLDPDGQGTGGAASGQGYSTGQIILTGLQPAQAEDKAAEGWEMAVYSYFTEPLDAEGTKFNMQIMLVNSGYRPFYGNIFYNRYKDGDSTPEVEAECLESVDEDGAVAPGEVCKLVIENLDASSLEDGKYTIELLVAGHDTPQDQYVVTSHIMAAPLEFEIKDGKVVYDSRPVIQVNDYSLEDLDMYVTALDGVRSKYAKLTLSLLNLSGIPYHNSFSIKLIYKNGVMMDLSQWAINLYEAQKIEPGEAIDIECPIYFNVASEVKIIVNENPVGDNPSQDAIFKENEITFVSEDEYHELIFADDPGYAESDGKLTFTVPVASCMGNPASQDPDFEYEMEREIECVVFDPVKEEIVATDKQTYSGQWHEINELVFAPDAVLENGSYVVAFLYKSAPNIMGEVLDLNLGVEEGVEGLPVTVTTSAINSIVSDTDNGCEEVYSISGTRVADASTLAPGLYISRKGNVVSKIIIK